MLSFLYRRIYYAIWVVFLVNLITFSMFFVVNTPDDVARIQLGGKYTSLQDIQQWKKMHNYDLPLFYSQNTPGWQKITKTLFYVKSKQLISFDFGQSLSGRNILTDIKTRMIPSLKIAIPSLIFGLISNILIGLMLLCLQGSRAGLITNITCISMMSISGMFYIIAGQYWLAKLAQLVPISGWQSGLDSLRFLFLPVLIAVVSGLGAGGRWYFSIFAEEWHKPYITTAKAKGISEWGLLLKHVLPNGLVPIVTGIVAVLPLLFMGSLLIESFFSIPGLGSYTLDAINQQDFEIIRVMVFFGTILYLLGLALTDVIYILIDPRIRLD